LKRLVVYVGYDYKSSSLIKKVMDIKFFFDDVRIIYVPDYDDNVLKSLSVPAVIIEEVGS